VKEVVAEMKMEMNQSHT